MIIFHQVTTLCYYGLTMAASDLSSDLFVNYILVILVEIPANFFCIYAMDKFGRKPLLVFSQILAGVACISAGLSTEYTSISWLPVIIPNFLLNSIWKSEPANWAFHYNQKSQLLDRQNWNLKWNLQLVISLDNYVEFSIFKGN